MSQYTEIPDEAQEGLERTGKIHLGVRVEHPKTGNEYPRNVDYFVCPPEIRKVFGEKPKTLLVVLPVDDPRHIVPHCFKKRGENGITCKGDGRTYTRWLWNEDRKKVEVSEGACPKPADCDFAYDESGRLVCGREANIQVMVPEVNDLYTFQIDTGDRQSILNIRRALFQVRAIRGTAAGHPILMRRVEMTYQSGPNKGKKGWPIVFRFLTEDEEAGVFKKYPRTARLCARIRELIARRRVLGIPQRPDDNELAENLLPADVVRSAVRAGATTTEADLDVALRGQGADAPSGEDGVDPMPETGPCPRCGQPTDVPQVDERTGDVNGWAPCDACLQKEIDARNPQKERKPRPRRAKAPGEVPPQGQGSPAGGGAPRPEVAAPGGGYGGAQIAPPVAPAPGGADGAPAGGKGVSDGKEWKDL